MRARPVRKPPEELAELERHELYTQLHRQGVSPVAMVEPVKAWLAEHGYRTDFGIWAGPDYEHDEPGPRPWSVEMLLRQGRADSGA